MSKKEFNGLFPALEAALKAATDPMSCSDLLDMAEIREHDVDQRRISDYLGNMWRKGLLIRTPAPKDLKSKARWRYEWKGNRGPKLHEHAFEYTPKVIADRPSMLITEEGNVITLEFQNLIISIRQKTPKNVGGQ